MRDFPDGTFRLGPRVMSLGFATRSGFDVAELARPHLEELSRRLPQNVNRGVPVFVQPCSVEELVAKKLPALTKTAAVISRLRRSQPPER